MICVVINGSTVEEASQSIGKAVEHADLIELRLDRFKSWDIPSLKKLRSQHSIPMIFTLRCQRQGGHYPLSEESRLEDIRRFAALAPEYIDLEDDISPDAIREIALLSPQSKIILSHHDLSTSPEDLDHLYQTMQKVPAHFYKIAATSRKSTDALRIVCWAKKLGDNRLIPISMGETGQISRILAPIIGSPITYAVLDDDQMRAPGQMEANILSERYRYHDLNRRTAIFGLIGNPVDRSVSDIAHNRSFKELGVDGVYIKMPVHPDDLSDFLQLAKQLPFSGLSVTMPLKESIMPFLDEVDPEAKQIGSVNTLRFVDGKIVGYNTDGFGALNALERECLVKDKHVVIIGAGGAAKAIVFETMKRGGRVTVLNRTAERAFALAERFHCTGNGLESMAGCASSGYDVVINCTPDDMPIDAKYLLPGSIVMDIRTRPKETPFLKCAMEKECRTVPGYAMFVEQGIGQFNLWLRP